MSHTPGPWTLKRFPDDAWSHVEVSDNRAIIVEGRSDVEAEANARLIAAAPDMLAVLKEISEWADNRMDIDWNDQPNDAMQVWSLLGDIIAKATGGAE